MKTRITTLKAWLFMTALAVFGIGFRVAGATPPINQFQAPTCWYQAGSVVGCVYEDGGTTWTSSAKAGDFSTLNVRQALTVDGGAAVHNGLTATGGMTASGTVALGLGGASVSTLAPTITTQGLSVDGGMVSDTVSSIGAITALAGSRVMVATHLMVTSDNSSQCYLGAVGTAITFSPAFGSGTPHCSSCVDITDPTKACGATATTTTSTPAGTGTDTVNICYQGIK